MLLGPTPVGHWPAASTTNTAGWLPTFKIKTREACGHAEHVFPLFPQILHSLSSLGYSSLDVQGFRNVRCMCVAGVSAKQVPAASAVTPIDEGKQTYLQVLERERCLLFVACT